MRHLDAGSWGCSGPAVATQGASQRKTAMLTCAPMAADPDLPPDYYWVNFRTVLETVLEASHALFDAGELAAMRRVLELPAPAGMLFARFVIRRGALFRADRLVYPEIGDVGAAAQLLAAEGYVELTPELSVQERLPFLSLADLKPVCADLGVDPRGRRGQVVARLLETPGFAARAAAAVDIWRPRHLLPFERARVAFFGNRHQGWTTFVLHELGRPGHAYGPYAVDRDVPLFASRVDLEAYIEAGARLDSAIDADRATLLALGEEAAAALERRPPVATHRRWADPAAEDEELVFLAAREYERVPEVARAEALYRTLMRTRRVPRRAARSADRLGLLLQRQGRAESFDPEPALALDLDDISRLRVRLRASRLGRGPDPRQALSAAPVRAFELEPCGHKGPKALYTLASGETGTIEQAVLEAMGGDGVYCEGALYRTLFSKLCWDEMFAPVPGMFQHAYQDAPLDFESDAFFRLRESPLRARFEALRRVDLDAEVRRAHATYAAWRARGASWRFDVDVLARAAATLGGGRLVPILERYARHPGRHRSGMPDLFVWTDDDCVLVEVKGPGDSLSLEQMLWHDHLLRHDIPVLVARVKAP